MKIHKRHLPVARETVPEMLGVRWFNGEGGDGGGSGGSGGSGNGSAGNGGQGSGSGSGNGGSGDGGQSSGSGAGDRGGAGGGNGTGSGSGGSAGGAGQSGNGSHNGGGSDSDRRLENQPQWVQQLVRDLRDEAAGNRTKKNDAERQITDLQRKVAAAFGIDVDGDGKPDPEKLAADLTKAQNLARQREVELAVYRAAGENNADPLALLDSRTFLDSVSDLDPNAQDFQTRLGDKIAAATQNNPRLVAGGQNGTGGRPGGGIGQGGRGQQSGPVGVAAGRALHQARKGNDRQNADSNS